MDRVFERADQAMYDEKSRMKAKLSWPASHFRGMAAVGDGLSDSLRPDK